MLSNRSCGTLMSDWFARCCLKSNTPHLTASPFWRHITLTFACKRVIGVEVLHCELSRHKVRNFNKIVFCFRWRSFNQSHSRTVLCLRATQRCFDSVTRDALGPDTELLYSYSLKCPDTKRRYHTACDKCHIQTKKHLQQAAEWSY